MKKTNKALKKGRGKTRKHRNTYSNNDYKSGDGMLTSVWGPPMWHYLHTMSFNYPVRPTPDEKKNYMNFVLSLQNVLPCKYCRQNLRTNFQQLPLTMAAMRSRATFSRYIYDLHELVNRMLKKTSNLTYCQVQERYEHFRARCTDDPPVLFALPTKKSELEKGCTEPLYGKKAKCVLRIVPQEEKQNTFQMDEKCVKKRQ
jgi:hypothetical protein